MSNTCISLENKIVITLTLFLDNLKVSTGGECEMGRHSDRRPSQFVIIPITHLEWALSYFANRLSAS